MESNEKIKEKALNIFKKAFPEQFSQIKDVKDIHNGYTNYSFLFELNDGTKYQVRIPHSSDLIDRKVEIEVLKLSDHNLFVYFDEKTGIAIKKWVEGYHPGILKIKSKTFNDILFKKIKHLHAISVDTKKIPIQKIGIDAFNQHLHNLAFDYQNKYLTLIDVRKNDPVVLSHSDINPLNVIVDDNDKITLIDFEWCCLASDYWDYANWIRETGFKFQNIDWKQYINEFSMRRLMQYLFICSTFSYLWTYVMPESKQIITYRKKVLKQVAKYYDLLIEYEQNNQNQ